MTRQRHKRRAALDRVSVTPSQRSRAHELLAHTALAAKVHTIDGKEAAGGRLARTDPAVWTRSQRGYGDGAYFKGSTSAATSFACDRSVWWLQRRRRLLSLWWRRRRRIWRRRRRIWRQRRSSPRSVCTAATATTAAAAAWQGKARRRLGQRRIIHSCQGHNRPDADAACVAEAVEVVSDDRRRILLVHEVVLEDSCDCSAEHCWHVCIRGFRCFGRMEATAQGCGHRERQAVWKMGAGRHGQAALGARPTYQSSVTSRWFPAIFRFGRYHGSSIKRQPTSTDYSYRIRLAHAFCSGAVRLHW